MTTKGVFLPPKDEQQLFCHSDFDSRYSELNLNQNYKCSKIFPIQFKSKSINENNKHFSNSFISDNQQKRKEPSLPWNKSTKSESFYLYNKIDEKQSQKQWKKDINSNANNKSTLSLHIKAYENSVENLSNLNSSKNVKIVNKCLNFSSKFRNSFEFARQRENESSTPEVMQFKASQKLYNPNVTYNFNYSDLEKALDETLISLGLEDDVLSEASTTIENPINKSPKLNHSVQTAVNRICNDLTVGIDYEMCAETAAFEEQNVQEIFDHSITSEDPAFRDFLDKTHLTLGTDYEIASIAPTIEDQSFQQTFNRSTNFEITTNSFFGGFNETEDILKNFDDVLDDDDFEEPEKQPYIPPTFFHPKSSTTFNNNNNNNNNSSFGETTNQNFGEYQTYQKRPPFEFFTPGGSVTVNTANTKPIPAFKGRCYSTSGHSISGRNVGDISFNETSETNASDTTFLSWGSRKLKCTKPPTGESSRAPYNFVPKVRNLAKIREDDIKSAKEYEKIYDFEEPLIVHGISDLVTIDEWKMAGFPEVLLQNISNSMYPKPRQVQRVSIPLILDSLDVLCCSETGSGKTAAFLIPIIAMCMQRKAEKAFISEPNAPFAVIIGPTRELIHQIFEQALKFTQNTGITVSKLYGEYAVRSNTREIENGCDLLITTPGRFHHFFTDDLLNLRNINFLVFDEGDTMLEKDFLEVIEPVIKHRNFPRKGYYQTLFFSATFGEYMIRAATRFMRRKKSASILSKKCSTNKLCMQEFQRVPKEERLEALKTFLDSKMSEVNMDSTKLPRILIFVNSQSFCDELTKILQTFGFGVIGIRGNYAQNLRLEAFEGFRDKRYPIMVSTDLCSKGIDIKDIELVINYELPYYIDTYIYRVGRVGRIREGQCLSFVDPDLNKFIVPKILQVLQVANHPVSSNFDEIVEECQRIVDDPSDGFDVFFDETTAETTAIQRGF